MGMLPKILACILCDDGRLILKVELMRSVGRSVFVTTKDEALWLANVVNLPTAWRQTEDGRVVVIQ